MINLDIPLLAGGIYEKIRYLKLDHESIQGNKES
jgi:hypothetical protein